MSTRSQPKRFREAEKLTAECGMRFENAAIVLERAERKTSLGARTDDTALAQARETFAELGAAPWLARAFSLEQPRRG
ncbi:MAG TPA: hypothetical protein VMA77_07405 [Solirubrobacteraceae bacterium]|nr:hypothetical protein [Solirubrobacteraceae bacterium]